MTDISFKNSTKNLDQNQNIYIFNKGRDILNWYLNIKMIQGNHMYKVFIWDVYICIWWILIKVDGIYQKWYFWSNLVKCKNFKEHLRY
jgi:hypothetical protein